MLKISEINEIKQALSKLNEAHTYLLYSKVAEKLAKRKVTVEWVDKRLLPDARAVALRRGDGGVIRVRDDLEPLQKLLSFLHECAHIRMHYGSLSNMSRTPAVECLSISPVLKHLRAAVSNEREREAVELSERWLRYADIHSTDSRISSKLLSLLAMSDT